MLARGSHRQSVGFAHVAGNERDPGEDLRIWMKFRDFTVQRFYSNGLVVCLKGEHRSYGHSSRTSSYNTLAAHMHSLVIPRKIYENFFLLAFFLRLFSISPSRFFLNSAEEIIHITIASFNIQ